MVIEREGIWPWTVWVIFKYEMAKNDHGCNISRRIYYSKNPFFQSTCCLAQLVKAIVPFSLIFPVTDLTPCTNL